MLEALEVRRLLSLAGPDGFGYQADENPFEALDLNPGAAGVIVALDGVDDDFAAIPLGSNTFSFYGATYTGPSALFVSDNGLITFGSGDPNYVNSDLATSPTQRCIAVLWDDWVTDVSTSGASNDSVIYRLDTSANRLIIEWNAVRSSNAPGGEITFQAILQLNTGSSAGTITLNYPDLDAGNPQVDDGAGATVGIKDNGAQGNNRLPISMNSGSGSVIGSGKAVRITRAAWTGAISGVVFLDFDADNLRDTGESGVSGSTVYLDLNGDGSWAMGEPRTNSAGGGSYAFAGLANGSYLVRLSPAAGFVSTNSRTVTISAGESHPGINLAAEKTAYSGTIGNDDYLIRRKSGEDRFELLIDGVITYTLLAPLFDSLSFDLSGGDDTLTVDYVNGPPTPALGISCDGGANGTPNGDVVRIIGGPVADSFAVYPVGMPSLAYGVGVGATVEHVSLSGGSGSDTLSLGAGPIPPFSIDVAGGLLDFAATTHLESLSIAGDGSATLPAANGALRTQSLSIAPGGRLDLADNDLVDDGEFSTILALVLSGFGNAGGGIASSTSDGSQILALFDNALVGLIDWAGEPIGANTIVGKYTYFGDINFDGQVTGDDYTIVDANLESDPAVGLEWLSGDANVDGIVTGDDYTIIDANLGLGVGNPISRSEDCRWSSGLAFIGRPS